MAQTFELDQQLWALPFTTGGIGQHFLVRRITVAVLPSHCHRLLAFSKSGDLEMIDCRRNTDAPASFRDDAGDCALASNGCPPPFDPSGEIKFKLDIRSHRQRG